jgi:CheY-like chemotaxis protein
MPPEIRAKVFEPFFTTKEVGKGSGLGLSQVLGFAKQSGGGIRIDSEPGKGTAVHIFLPRATGRPLARAVENDPARPAGRKGAAILLVDDDAAVRDVTAAMLRDLGYAVSEADSGETALGLIGRERFDLAVIDFAMPGMSGGELARTLRTRLPKMPVLFVTGFAERAALGGIKDGQIVSKPYVTGELAQKVQLALADLSGAEAVA